MKLTVAAAAAAALALLLGSAAQAAPVPETRLRPASLDRGPNVTIPHLDGKTVVDGTTRIRVDAGAVRLLGKSGTDYVVGASNTNGDDNFRVLRFTPSGSRTVLLRGVPIWELVLSDDGTQIGRASGQTARHTLLVVWSALDGHRQASRRFNGSVSILDGDGHRMVLGGWGPNRTFWWNPAKNTTARIADRPGYAADIGADRLAMFTKDPFFGGCSVVTTLKAPRERLWKSCRQRVATFAPRGTRMATIDLLSDGIGPADVWLRGSHGRALAHYTAKYFGALDWESDRSFLLDTFGTVKAATVRCVIVDCERASRLRPVPNLRVTTPGPR